MQKAAASPLHDRVERSGDVGTDPGHRRANLHPSRASPSLAKLFFLQNVRKSADDLEGGDEERESGFGCGATVQIFYSLSAAVAGGTARDVAKIETAREGRTRTVGFGLRLFSPSSGVDCFQATAFASVRQATGEL